MRLKIIQCWFSDVWHQRIPFRYAFMPHCQRFPGAYEFWWGPLWLIIRRKQRYTAK